MTPEEIRAARGLGGLALVEGIDPATASLVGEHLCISGKVPIRIGSVSPFIDRSTDLAVIDDTGIAFATLTLVKFRPPQKKLEMTSSQYVAYLLESNTEDLSTPDYVFKSDYIVIDQSHLDEYLTTYKAGSPLWGNFSHDESPAFERTGGDIHAVPGIQLPTVHHNVAFSRYTAADSVTDRYLKLYHTVELIFDFVAYRRIIKAGDGLLGFGQVISGYSSKEFDKLRKLIAEFCPDKRRLAESFAHAAPYRAEAEAIFQDHSKEYNPLKSDDSWKKFWNLIDSGTLSPSDAISCKLVSNNSQYEALIVNEVSYWIYRIRSSIAHSRVGEYLLGPKDEKFVEYACRRVLLEVCTQVMGSSELKTLMAP